MVAVRADATLEEGWFYEGAGIYRHVWLDKTDPVHVAPFGTFVSSTLTPDMSAARIDIECKVDNKGVTPASYSLLHRVVSPSGETVAEVALPEGALLPKEGRVASGSVTVTNPEALGY